MQLTRQSIELLAPVGTWDSLEAAGAAGADAVYLGGKRFNMRMHRSDSNFDDAKLAKAIEFAHTNNMHLYVTLNNLISQQELPSLRFYLDFLNQVKPDGLIVQDLAVMKLCRELGITIPLHASVMMNTHNEAAVRELQLYGITRVVFNREMSLADLALIKERTGIEVEYFIHGDMCIAHSGQCLHSGVIFGQSGSRGRCLKPCRWPYHLIERKIGQPFDAKGNYLLAMNDMCLYQHLPQLIQAGVYSFKIEGRMRTADFVGRVVGLYRRAIDNYMADPTGYEENKEDWANLYENRVRDYTTCYAFGNPGASGVGFSGEREPRFFSQAVIEAPVTFSAVAPEAPVKPTSTLASSALLSVRVADLAALKAACEHGANIIYVGGESFKPALPWTRQQLTTARELAAHYAVSLIVTTPRITTARECNELASLFAFLQTLQPQGIMVSNIGSLALAGQLTELPLHADFSFNLFNSYAAAWLKEHKVVKATTSLEASFEQIRAMTQQAILSLETIVHGPIESMVMDYCLPKALLTQQAGSQLCTIGCATADYCLEDSAGQSHKVAIDQYCRNHVLFAKDLCLMAYLPALKTAGINHFRIEGQHYAPDYVGQITAAYREQLDQISSGQLQPFTPDILGAITAAAPRPLGIGAFRYRASR